MTAQDNFPVFLQRANPSDLYDYEQDNGIFVGLAPDDFHKDNVSVGNPMAWNYLILPRNSS
jgi:hypothetical protein